MLYYKAKDVANREIAGRPTIKISDTTHHNKKFNCNPSFYYPYYEGDKFMFYIVRWDLPTKKETRPFVFNNQLNQWESKRPVMETLPLYNIKEAMNNTKKPILHVEGEKCVEVARSVFKDYVCLTSVGGSATANKSDYSAGKEREIVIAPDCDEAGMKYAIEVANNYLDARAKSVRILNTELMAQFVINNNRIEIRKGDVKEKYDIADAIEEGWTLDLIKKAENHETVKGFIEESLKDTSNIGKAITKPVFYQLDGELLKRKIEVDLDENDGDFELRRDGVYCKVKVKETSEDGKSYWNEKEFKLCGYLKCVAILGDERDEDYSKQFEMISASGKLKSIFIGRAEKEAAIQETLEYQGLYVYPSKEVKGTRILTSKLLYNYVRSCTSSEFATSVNKQGWHDNTYLISTVNDPHKQYTIPSKEKSKRLVFRSNATTQRELETKGTLKDWQDNVGVLVKGNTLLMASCAFALSSTVMNIIDKHEKGGFCVYTYGTSSKGKTKGSEVAQSIWGFKDLSSFRATDNAAESIFKAHNNGIVIMDELGQAEANAIHHMIYLIGNGVCKARANKNGEAKAVVHFSTICLGSGEHSIKETLKKNGKTHTGGHRVRFIEIPANQHKGYGAFDTIHDYEDAKTFATRLSEACAEYKGAVIDAWLRTFISEDHISILQKIDELRAQWLNDYLPKKADGQIGRVANKLALAAAVGEMAIKRGVFNFEAGSMMEALGNLFDKWIENEGGIGSHECKQVEYNLIKCVTTNIHEFIDPRKEHQSHGAKAGYLKCNGEEIEQLWIYPTFFIEQILEHKDRREICKILVEKGVLIKGDKESYTTAKRVEGGEFKRFYVIDYEKLKEVVEELNKSFNTKATKQEEIASGKELKKSMEEMERIKSRTDDNNIRYAMDEVESDNYKLLKQLITRGWGVGGLLAYNPDSPLKGVLLHVRRGDTLQIAVDKSITIFNSDGNEKSTHRIEAYECLENQPLYSETLASVDDVSTIVFDTPSIEAVF